MKKLIYYSEDIMCMSDVRGRKIKVESNVPFSFYYSARNSSHGPRVKVVSDPNRMHISIASNLSLVGDWRFTQNRNADRLSSSEIAQIKNFFKRYLVMLLLVWDSHCYDEASFRDYLECEIDLQEFISQLNFYPEYSDILDTVTSVKELEQVCRENNLVNFYGN